MAQHLFDDLFAAQRPHRAALNQPPVAQHRQGVADRLQLMDTMRNKHHPDPLMLQTAYYRKQTLTFMLIQRRSGFIEDQKAAMVRQGAGQQDLLFFGERAAVNGAPDVQRHIQLRQRLVRQLPNPRPAEGHARPASLSSIMFSAMLRPGTSATSTSCCTRWIPSCLASRGERMVTGRLLIVTSPS